MKSKIGDREYTKRDILKYKIWKNLGVPRGCKADSFRECPFSGEKISVSDLLNGNRFQIEHLIPFSKSFDDSLDNKVLASIQANKYKANKTPYEAFHDSKNCYDWEAIKQRARKLSPAQQWRFGKNAMEEFEKKVGPIARSLNDTRYMTRLLQSYLRPIVKQNGKETVQAVAGALTALIREAWGLNIYKNKEDEEAYRAVHNHHAIDAIVVAAIGRHQIAETQHNLKNVYKSVEEEFKAEFYKLKDASVSAEEKKNLRQRIRDSFKNRQSTIVKKHIPCPANINVNAIGKTVENINISHKINQKKLSDKNSTVGQLHEDTAYGFKGFMDEKSLKAKFKCGKKIQEKEVVEYIPMFYDTKDKNAYYDAYKTWFILDGKASTLNAQTKEEKAIKSQLQQEEQQAILSLREASTKAFKWFIGGNNFCAEIYQINPQNKIKGVPTKNQGEWKSEIISNYNATVRHSRGECIGYWVYKYPNAKRIMTLRRNDMVMATFTREQAFDEKFSKGIQEYVRQKFADNHLEQVDVLFRVKKMGGNSIYLIPHDIAKEEKDTKSWIASVGGLQKYKARKVVVTSTGRIKYAQ